MMKIKILRIHLVWIIYLCFGFTFMFRRPEHGRDPAVDGKRGSARRAYVFLSRLREGSVRRMQEAKLRLDIVECLR